MNQKDSLKLSILLLVPWSFIDKFMYNFEIVMWSAVF